ncbi:MAG: type IV pili twitching motility protein PilT, partial [Deltaproteobacteria bacterium]|nr:type IV pili twitching motility protein PilT [Deltaproteobacteria bacterium]
MDRDTLLRYLHGAVQLGASDVHFKAGSPQVFRINKTLRPSREEPLTTTDTRE